jgi:hypothetical protein
MPNRPGASKDEPLGQRGTNGLGWSLRWEDRPSSHTFRTTMGAVRFEGDCLSFVAIRSWLVQRPPAVLGEPAGRAARRVRRQVGPACPSVPGSSLAGAPSEAP